MALAPVSNEKGLPPAFEEQRMLQRLRDDPIIYRALRDIFVERREARRTQAEAANGEQAMVLRGRCVELTAILNELFPNVKE